MYSISHKIATLLPICAIAPHINYKHVGPHVPHLHAHTMTTHNKHHTWDS